MALKLRQLRQLLEHLDTVEDILYPPGGSTLTMATKLQEAAANEAATRRLQEAILGLNSIHRDLDRIVIIPDAGEPT